MIVLQSKFSKLATKKFSRYHRNILKIRFLSLNILKQHITSSQHQQKQTNKWKKRLSKAILLWWFCRKPQNSHRKFVAKQCATVGILQLLQLTHNKKIFFFQLYGKVSILFLSTGFHVMDSCMTDPCALAGAGHRNQAAGAGGCLTCWKGRYLMLLWKWSNIIRPHTVYFYLANLVKSRCLVPSWYLCQLHTFR